MVNNMPSRRTVVAGAVAGGVALPVLAACGSSGATAKAGTKLGATSDIPVGGGKIFDDAQLHGDGKALTDVLADDYTLVNGGATVSGKAEFIRDYTDPKFKPLPFDIDQQIIKVWPNGAVLGGHVVFRFTQDGKPGESDVRFADIWAKRGGQWRVIFTEVTRLPKT